MTKVELRVIHSHKVQQEKKINATLTALWSCNSKVVLKWNSWNILGDREWPTQKRVARDLKQMVIASISQVKGFSFTLNLTTGLSLTTWGDYTNIWPLQATSRSHKIWDFHCLWTVQTNNDSAFLKPFGDTNILNMQESLISHPQKFSYSLIQSHIYIYKVQILRHFWLLALTALV